MLRWTSVYSLLFVIPLKYEHVQGTLSLFQSFICISFRNTRGLLCRCCTQRYENVGGYVSFLRAERRRYRARVKFTPKSGNMKLRSRARIFSEERVGTSECLLGCVSRCIFQRPGHGFLPEYALGVAFLPPYSSFLFLCIPFDWIPLIIPFCYSRSLEFV